MNLVSRITNIVTKPKDEWPVIAAEPATVQSLFTSVVLPLAAIAPICNAINSLVFGHGIPLTGLTWRPSPLAAVTGLVVSYVLSLLGVALTSFIVEKLAPSFQSKGDLAQAMKVVVYAQTPVWVAGVLNIVPFLGILVILVGIYALYLAYLGLPVVMQTPQEKVVPYLVVVIVVTIVLWVVFGFISAAVIGTGAMVSGAWQG